VSGADSVQAQPCSTTCLDTSARYFRVGAAETVAVIERLFDR
jgi:hypothetical protein